MGAAADAPLHLSSEQSNSASAASSNTGQDLLTSGGAGWSQSKAAAAKSGNYMAAFVEFLPLTENYVHLRCEIETPGSVQEIQRCQTGVEQKLA